MNWLIIKKYNSIRIPFSGTPIRIIKNPTENFPKVSPNTQKVCDIQLILSTLISSCGVR